MNKKRKHDIRFYKALEKVMNVFKEKRTVSKRELRQMGFCNPITLNAILKELEGEGYIINNDQKKKTWGLQFHYNETLNEIDRATISSRLANPLNKDYMDLILSTPSLCEALWPLFTKENSLRHKLLAPILSFGEEDFEERKHFLGLLEKYLLQESKESEATRHRVIRNMKGFYEGEHRLTWLSPPKYRVLNPETQQLEEGTFQEVWEKRLVWNFRYLISKSYEDLSELERLIFFFFLDWDLWNQNELAKLPEYLIMLFFASNKAYWNTKGLSHSFILKSEERPH